jgi:hypothetical protein
LATAEPLIATPSICVPELRASVKSEATAFTVAGSDTETVKSMFTDPYEIYFITISSSV